MALTGSAPWGPPPAAPTPYGPPVPPPPPGPGVQPPFVAPPTDGTSRRRWIAGGLWAGAAVLLCVAGIAGIIGVGVLIYQVVRDEAHTSVEAYLTALYDQDYGQAYGLLCDRVQATTPYAQFMQQNSEPRVTGFHVGATVLDDNGDLVVPATVEYSNDTEKSVRYVMFQNPQTGNLEVCGESG